MQSCWALTYCSSRVHIAHLPTNHVPTNHLQEGPDDYSLPTTDSTHAPNEQAAKSKVQGLCPSHWQASQLGNTWLRSMPRHHSQALMDQVCSRRVPGLLIETILRIAHCAFVLIFCRPALHHVSNIRSLSTGCHLVMLCIGELQGQLGGLNVKCADAGFCTLDEVSPVLPADLAFLRTHQLPSQQAYLISEMRPDCASITRECRTKHLHDAVP